ncbi:hypothetical protein VPHD260_0100 [Vibrio phage D260]
MAITHIVAGPEGDAGNTNGTQLALSINQVITLSEAIKARIDDLGVLTTDIIPDNSSLEAALESLDAAINAAVANRLDDLGTFTGVFIPANSTLEEALQALSDSLSKPRLDDLGTLNAVHIDDNMSLEQALLALDAAIPTSNLTWMLSTSVFSAPVIGYQAFNMQINSTGTFSPVALGGTEPFTSYAVTTGALPAGVTLNAETGVVSYNTGGTTESGSVGITAYNPVGASTEYTVNYNIAAPQGAEEFTNSLNKYPAMWVSTSNSNDTQVMIKHPTFTGTVASGTMSTGNYPVYTASNGNGTWNVMINDTGTTYWRLYINSAIDPATYADSLVTDLNTSALTYDLVTPNSQDVLVDTLNYPSDQTDVHYITSQNYLALDASASLDGFMSRNSVWSFGFRLEEDIPTDGLGRVLFSREGRNWAGMYVGHNGTYTNLLYGNGASTSYTGDTTYPSSGFSAGQYVRVTFAANVLKVFVDGTEYFSSTSAYIYWDTATSANSLPVHFGRGVGSNSAQTNYSYHHSYWQGTISRLWIANGLEITTEDDGTTFPVGSTHTWLLDETSGTTMIAQSGGVAITGVNNAL